MQVGRQDFNYKLVRFFFSRTRLVLLILLAISVGGIFAFLTLRREGFPNVTPKVIGISTVYPGASATEVESQISRPVETALRDLNNVSDISSTSANSFSQVVINLNQNADLDVALQEVRSKIASIDGQLPQEAQDSQVQTFSASGDSFTLGITSNSKNLTDLRKETETLIAELEQVTGIREIKEVYEAEERLVINYDPQKLAQNNLNISQIDLILKGSNIDFPLGTLDVGDRRQSVVVLGAYRDKGEIENQIIGVSPTGVPVALKDVATVQTEVNGQDRFERIGLKEKRKLTAKDGILVGVNVSQTSDILKAKEALDQKIQQLKEEEIIAEDTKITFLMDQSHDTQEQLDEIVAGAVGNSANFYLLGGIQLVILFMLLFVNWRAALVAALAIPLSFLFTLLTLYLLGIQLNTIVLFSLILVLGLIVDPAIVVLESIQRYKDLGRNGEDSVLQTALRYGSGLFIAVLTSVIVFIPFGIVSGIFGEIIKYIPLTVIPALFASYLVPMIILPPIAARFLKKRKTTKKLSEDDEIWVGGRAMMTINRWILSNFFRKLLALIVVGVLIFFSVRIAADGSIPVVQFSTPEDNEVLTISVTYPKGASFERKNQLAKAVEAKLTDERGIKNYYYFLQGQDSSSLLLNLEENRGEGDKSKEIRDRLLDEYKQLAGVEVTVEELSVGPPASEYPIQVQLFDNDLANLEKAAKEVGNFLRSVDGVSNVDDGFTDKGETRLALKFDREKLAQTGLSLIEVSQILKSRLGESESTKFTDQNDKSFEVFLSPLESSIPNTKERLNQTLLPTRTGQVITLQSIATIEETTTLDRIERFDGSRFINVRAKIESDGDLQAVQKKLDDYLTDGKIADLGLESKANRGENEEIAESFQELFVALFAAIFLTYVVLVLQFNSFSQPVIMLFTIPLSLVGVFPALLLVKGQLGFLEILGLTILVGIVENVAIFLIDYANQLVKERKMSLKEAIVLSSGVRFRPIILTKLVALGGLLPLAIESPFWRGLSAVIIGGILVSGFLSLIVVPILYTWFGSARDHLYRVGRA